MDWVYSSDYITLQEAIDDAETTGRCLVVEGENVINAPLRVRKGGYRWAGAHNQITTIQTGPGYSGYEMLNVSSDDGSPIEHFSIEKVGFYGDRALGGIVGVRLYRCLMSAFSHLYIKDVGTGIKAKYSHDIGLAGITVQDFADIGIDLARLNHNARFKGCRFLNYSSGGQHSPESCIGIGTDATAEDRAYSSAVMIEGCRFEAEAVKFCIRAKAGRGLSIAGNYIEIKEIGNHGGSGHPIAVYLGDHNAPAYVRGAGICGNHFQGVNLGKKAVHFARTHGALISHNHCDNFDQFWTKNSYSTGILDDGTNVVR